MCCPSQYRATWRLATAAVVACLACCPTLQGAEGQPDAQNQGRQKLVAASPRFGAATEMMVPSGPMLSPADPNPIPAVDCVNHCPPGYEATWRAIGPVWGFQEWAQGEYVGRARIAHVPAYRLRVDDQLEFVFRVTRNEIASPYKLNVCDEIMIESTNEAELRRTLVVLPDGTLTLPLLGSVRAAQVSVHDLREDLNKRY